MGSKSSSWCLYKRKEINIWTQDIEESHREKLEAEIGVMRPQDKKCLASPELEETRKITLPKGLLMPWFQILRLQTCDRISFCCLKPPDYNDLLQETYEATRGGLKLTSLFLMFSLLSVSLQEHVYPVKAEVCLLHQRFPWPQWHCLQYSRYLRNEGRNKWRMIE